MTDKTIDKIVQRQLKWYTAEVILLWLLISLGIVLIIAGAGIYFYIGKIVIIEYLSTIHAHRLAISQVRMLHNFSRVLGIVFTLVGIVCIVFALDRLALRKVAYRMALFIKDRVKESK
ncbi:hypothetical protein J7K28_03995 [Candidatus Aerophobetes bacterium]|nr:hypothetical protein [Candidatus Aerophobetes bacterium]